MLTSPDSAVTATREPEWPKAIAEYRQLLSDLIAVDSANPPGNELTAAALLKTALEREGIACTLYETAPGRGNLVARLKGNGKKRPLLLLGHIDVVGVDSTKWQSPPFEMTERDGFLYGRGVIDDKGMVAAEATSLIWLKRLKVPLERDVILLAECDEESGGEMGVAWMLEHHREAIDAEYAVNEGGRTTLAGDRVGWVGVQNAEKRSINVTLIARGQSGHASMPRQDNCVASLGKALARFAEPVFPVELTPETRAFFPAIAAVEPPALADAMRGLASADSSRHAERVGEYDLMFGAMVRTTVSPTIVNGGFRANVIPSEARATLNVRMIPGSDPEKVTAKIREIVNDPRVEVAMTPPRRPEAPSMPFDGPVVDAVRSVGAKMAPGAPVVPLLSTGATDSAQLRSAGIKAYGLLPFPLTTDDVGRMHGDNERMPVTSLGFGLQMTYRVAAEIARAR
jgi:acetylornithine deacetylase/succinyl-diaminopimelate desuccinylase-like protein